MNLEVNLDLIIFCLKLKSNCLSLQCFKLSAIYLRLWFNFNFYFTRSYYCQIALVWH